MTFSVPAISSRTAAKIARPTPLIPVSFRWRLTRPKPARLIHSPGFGWTAQSSPRRACSFNGAGIRPAGWAGKKPGGERPARPLRGTVRTQPHQGKVAEPGFVAEAPANRLAGRVELAGLDTDNLAAALADQVLALALAEERVEAGTVAQVNVPDDAHRLEPLEVAVDRGEVEGGAAVGQPLGDPLGRHRRVGGEELVEDHPARGLQPAAGGADRGGDVLERLEPERRDPRRLGHGATGSRACGRSTAPRCGRDATRRGRPPR